MTTTAAELGLPPVHTDITVAVTHPPVETMTAAERAHLGLEVPDGDQR